MKSCFKVLLTLIVLAVLGVVGYLGYLGFVPGVSNIMGANKPKDLGVVYTEADYDSFMAKTQTNYLELTIATTPDKSIVFSGQKDLNTTFTDAEGSSRFNYDQWAYMPITNVQLRFNGDGSLEISANLIMNRIDGFIQSIGGVGYFKEDIEKGMGYLGMIKNNPPVYMKARASVTNNKPTIDLQAVEVGKIRVPIEKIDSSSFLERLTSQVFARVPGFHANSFTISEGKASFSGKIPSKLEVQFAK